MVLPSIKSQFLYLWTLISNQYCRGFQNFPSSVKALNEQKDDKKAIPSAWVKWSKTKRKIIFIHTIFIDANGTLKATSIKSIFYQ